MCHPLATPNFIIPVGFISVVFGYLRCPRSAWSTPCAEDHETIHSPNCPGGPSLRFPEQGDKARALNAPLEDGARN
eukprot:13480-Pyramimonas_sp.AAC.1